MNLFHKTQFGKSEVAHRQFMENVGGAAGKTDLFLSTLIFSGHAETVQFPDFVDWCK